MYNLIIELEAKDDIRTLLATGHQNRQCATRILAFLEQLKADQKLLSSLLDHGFDNKDFNVSRIESIWQSRDVWRLKIFEWDLSKNKKYTIPYRIIYAYDLKLLTFRILAVAHRSFNYEANHPITQRVIRTYDNLGLQMVKTYHGSYKH